MASCAQKIRLPFGKGLDARSREDIDGALAVDGKPDVGDYNDADLYEAFDDELLNNERISYWRDGSNGASVNYRTSNAALLLVLRKINSRKNYSNECKVSTIMALHGAWGGQRHVWTFREKPCTPHHLVYNPSAVDSPPDPLMFPSAAWYFDANKALAAGMSRPPPSPARFLWPRYYVWMTTTVLERAKTEPCQSCQWYCWRVMPHVELADFTNRLILEAWGRFARRDPAGVLHLFVNMGISTGISENCVCSECLKGSIEATIALNDTMCKNGTIDNAGDHEDERTSEDYKHFERERFAPPPVTRDSDYDFVAKRRYGRYTQRVVQNVSRDVRRWHTGNLGTVLRWLLEHHIDTLEHSAKIDEAFRLLYRAGSVALALILGMYASRKLVHAEIERFHSIHAGPRTPAMRHIQNRMFLRCDNACSCWAACTSSECRVAVYMLAAARNVSLPDPCADSAVCGRLQRIAYTNALMNASDAEVMTETIESTRKDEPIQPVVPESIVSLAWRRLLVADGMTALLKLPKQLDLPESYAAYTQAAYRRVHLLSDRFYVNELLQRDDSLLGEFCHLLGRCEPCIVHRQPWRMGNLGREQVPLKRMHPSLIDRTNDHLVSETLRWKLARGDSYDEPIYPTSDESSDDEPAEPNEPTTSDEEM